MKKSLVGKKRAGSALMGAIALCLVSSLLIGGAMALTSSQRALAKTRSDSESALLIAEAGVNDEINRISTRMASFAANQWATAPTQTTGEPYRGRKGVLDGVNGAFWVYVATTENGTTAWDGTGDAYVIANAKVGGAWRRVSVQAQTVDDPNVAPQFNTVIFSNADTSGGGHSDGPVAVGGNWNGSYESGQQGTAANFKGCTKGGIFVKGNCTPSGSTKKCFGGNNAYVGGSCSSSMQMNGNGSVITTVPTDTFDKQKTHCNQQTANIRNCTKQTVTATTQNFTLNCATNTLNGSKKCYSISPSKLNNYGVIDIINMQPTDTVIIDVTGSYVDWKTQVNCQYKNKLIWNFKDATQIDINRQFDGSILAPNAYIKQSQNVQGNMVCNTWSTHGAPELHYGSSYKFTGDAYQPPVQTGCTFKASYKCN